MLFSSSKEKARAAFVSSDEFNSAPPPHYKEAIASQQPIDASSSSCSGGFVATNQLQVQAIGYDTNQALTGKFLENITVYNPSSGQAEYISVRLKRSSNSCALVRAADPSQSTLISTIYRMGPGRRPRMRIMPASGGVSVEAALDNKNVRGELVEVKSRSLVSRAQVFDTSLGKFEWRYGGGGERDEACDADSLLVLERVDSDVPKDADKGKHGVRIAQFIRNDEFRTPESKKYSGGNGGRLMLDLRMWQGEKQGNTAEIEAFAVASCILMLKREADRFINNSIAAVS